MFSAYKEKLETEKRPKKEDRDSEKQNNWREREHKSTNKLRVKRVNEILSKKKFINCAYFICATNEVEHGVIDKVQRNFVYLI